jgi:hypothetical protein
MDISKIEELHKVFPSLIPLKGKKPLEDDWQLACEKARPFDAQEFKTCNAGIPCGPANGIIVIDVDSIQGFNEWLKGRGYCLPQTRTHLTGTAKPHYIFGYPQNNGHRYGNRAIKNAKGDKIFDIRGIGGQVVGPGSIHPDTGREYVVRLDLPIVPAPDWLLDLSKNELPHNTVATLWQKKKTDPEAIPVSYAVKKLIIEGETKGKRSEAVMSVLNALVRAGQSDAQIIAIFEAHAIGEKYREAGHTRERWLLRQVARVRAGVTPRADPKSAVTMAELREYIDLSVDGGQGFTAEDVCRAFGAYRKEHRAPIYIYLSRLVEEKILRKDPYQHGGYKKALQIPSYELSGGTDSIILEVDLPLDLHKLIAIEPNHLISIAGATDAGKSAFLYHVMKLNYRELKVIHFSSPEWDQNAIKKRMDAIGIERPHPNITCYPMLQGYEDLIPQEPCLVLVDYLRTSERFNELDHQYHAILRNLNGGVAFTAIQKHIGIDKPTGGQYAIHAAHHVILLDPWNDVFVCKILKTKNERHLSGYYRVFDYKHLLLSPRSREWKKGEIFWGKPKQKQNDGAAQGEDS